MSTRGAAPADAEIREALRRWLRMRHARDPGTAVIEELGLRGGLVRVDVAVVNGLLHGYEIKSERDGLRRLASQVELYGGVLDRATLVAGGRHLARALDLIPDWWGVLRVDPGPSQPRLVSVRRGRRNPARDARALAELLWREEALALLAEHAAERGVRSKPRPAVWDRVGERVPVEGIAAAVRARLKARSWQRADPAPS